MKRKTIVIFLFILLFTIKANADGLTGCEEHVKYGAPSSNPVLLCRLGYALSHNSDLKVPMWIAYHLTREKLLGTHPRSDNFRPDPDLKSGQRSELKDYKRSGFDRGHMAPAGSMKWSARTMSESFLLSNMTPQVGAGFNRGIWRVLEEKIRKWTRHRRELYIVTGPIFASEDYKYLKDESRVAIPTHFYKVIFDPIRVDAIAFVLPNKKLKTKDLPNYLSSVDQVEAFTGLDFLSEIEDSVENIIEAIVQTKMWSE